MKTYYALLISAFFLLSFSNSYSQKYFKASEGLSKAVEAAETSGMDNPYLMAIGTISGKIPGFEVDIEYDMDEGTSVAWLYILRSADGEDIKAFAVIYLLVSYMATEISMDLLPDLPITPKTPLSEGWKDSDEIGELIKTNQKFIDFKSAYPDMILLAIGLAVNDVNPLLELMKPYWSCLFTPGSEDLYQLTCFVHAETGEVICLNPTSVEGTIDAVSPIQAYPNPAGDHVMIVVPNELQTAGYELSIFDVKGNIVQKVDHQPRFGDAGGVRVETLNLQSGVYIIHYTDKDVIINAPFIISR